MDVLCDVYTLLRYIAAFMIIAYTSKSVECLPPIVLGCKMSWYEVALAYPTDPGPQSMI